MSEAHTQHLAASKRGSFITLEGGEGAGKSTQLQHLLRNLRNAGIEAMGTREPGGSHGAEILRGLLLSGKVAHLGPAAEALLFAAARIDHIEETIRPALDAGTFVVSDRFSDSTRAYQGALGQLEPRFLRALERVTLDGVLPDLTLILDLPVTEGLARAASRRGAGDVPDRYESEDVQFHESLRTAFLSIAVAEPDRCVVIDASRSEEQVARSIFEVVSDRLLSPATAKQAGYG